jgi:hypothetical protein
MALPCLILSTGIVIQALHLDQPFRICDLFLSTSHSDFKE